VINAASFLFVRKCMPETRGRTLEDRGRLPQPRRRALRPRGAGRRARLL